MTLYKWSQIAAADATADSSVNWQEGQAPSSINDSARAMMAAMAKYRDDVAGAIVTSGTSTAYTVLSFQVFDSLSRLNGQTIAFTPHITNGATVTLNVDGLGAKPLRSAPSTELPAGVLVQGTPYVALYNNSDAAFYLRDLYANPYNIPIGGGMDYWGTALPNSNFAFPIGQAISRTTYSALFAVMGSTYGAGDGSTTFNLPDKTGRVSAMKEAAATRLTSTYFGGNSTNMGAVGGLESKVLATANLPPYTPSGSIVSTGTAAIKNASYNVTGGAGAILYDNANTPTTLPLTISSTFTGTAQGGLSTPFAVVQPTIICNYIIRII